MTAIDLLRPFYDWKFSALIVLFICGVVTANTVVILWLEAGPPSQILVEKSTMKTVRAGDMVEMAVLRNTKRTDCKVETTRTATRDSLFVVPPEMRKADPKLPPVINSPVSYPIYNGPIPGSHLGIGVTRFAFIVPKEWPPGHYHYHAVIRSTCPVIPERESAHASPDTDDTTFDVLPAQQGAADAAQIMVNDKAAAAERAGSPHGP